MSVRTAALLVAALHVIACGVHLFINILDASGAISAFGHRGCIDLIIINAVSVIINILLIVGIDKRKLSLMKPATVYYLVVAALSFGLGCAGYLYIAMAVPSGWASLVLVGIGLIIAICCYFWLIVYGYYRQLKNELLVSSTGEEVNNSPVAGVTHLFPKYEDERELPPHYRT